jgi:hypothetical protein
VSGFLTRLVARGAGVRLVDAPPPLAARVRSRFEPLPAMGDARETTSFSDAPTNDTDVQAVPSAPMSNAATATAGQAGPLRHQQRRTAVPDERRAQPAREMMQPALPVQAGRRRGDASDALTDMRSDQPTSSSDHRVRHAVDAEQAGRLPSAASPAPAGLRPGTPRSETGFVRSAHFDPVEPARDERVSAAQVSSTDGSGRPDLEERSDGDERAQAANAIAPLLLPRQAPDRAGPPPATIPLPERGGPETLVSIGRIDVIFEAEASPAPQVPRRPSIERTRGFAGYEAVRRGIRR